jgi:tetratricopeptide (TPR) repeat protein
MYIFLSATTNKAATFRYSSHLPMRNGLWISVTLFALAMSAGCRLPGWDAPISQSLVDCRKLSREGVAAMEQGQRKEAEMLLAKAVHACPSDTEARRNYAEILWQRGAQKEAIEQMELGVKTAQEDPAFRVRLAEMYLTAGKSEQAARTAQQALDLDPKSAAAWAIHAGVMQAAGQPQQAMSAYLHALGLDPQDRRILLAVAELYREMNQPDRALQTLQTLAESYSPGEEPQNVLYLTGAAYQALGRCDEAVESMKIAVERGKPNSDLLCRLAEAEHLAGRDREAAATVAQALALQPQHKSSRELLERIQLARQSQGERVIK